MRMNGLMAAALLGAASMGAMATDNKVIMAPAERRLAPVKGERRGKDKRKAQRRAYHAARLGSRRTAPLGTSNPFKHQPRRDAYDAALHAGSTRNEAMKAARRVLVS